jgi:alginate O-acetyltransferase complex protein AlgI
MLFSSAFFLVYFLPAVAVLYYVLPRRFRNFFLLLASAFFYAWGAPRFVFVVLATTFADFHLVQWMQAAPTLRRKRLLLCASIGLNLTLLAACKYIGFAADNANLLLAALRLPLLPVLQPALPLGISFFTFETMTYVVDVYRGVQRPLRRFWDYQLYILLFPKLLAGPIVRYHEIADQIADRAAAETPAAVLAGFQRFAFGLARKVLIADVLARHVDQVFALPTASLSAPVAWVGALAFVFQIYFDFAGYSDMAIGLGQMLGFRLPENFDSPLVSASTTELWRRWHMTLGHWMRDYLYRPLGGNRASAARVYVNLGIVFLASGLWHGARWTFVVWGAWNGALLMLERRWPVLLEGSRPLRIALTFLAFTLGMVVFRSPDLARAGAQLLALVTPGEPGLLPDLQVTLALLAAAAFSFSTLSPAGARLQELLLGAPGSVVGVLVRFAASVSLFVLSLSAAAFSPFTPFVYFRF